MTHPGSSSQPSCPAASRYVRRFPIRAFIHSSLVQLAPPDPYVHARRTTALARELCVPPPLLMSTAPPRPALHYVRGRHPHPFMRPPLIHASVSTPASMRTPPAPSTRVRCVRAAGPGSALPRASTYSVPSAAPLVVVHLEPTPVRSSIAPSHNSRRPLSPLTSAGSEASLKRRACACMPAAPRHRSRRAFREAEGIAELVLVGLCYRTSAPAGLLPYYSSSRGAPLLAPRVVYPPPAPSRLLTYPTAFTAGVRCSAAGAPFRVCAYAEYRAASSAAEHAMRTGAARVVRRAQAWRCSRPVLGV
ncbi:hypothetical protein HYPSUDRAFT_38442 [Hypholoma sublateritium FD-334 SS-4]|uniref:Uncharacterized protein n=1 Tax=Hypholoma sublateritium (strain FD-334 SS-4) TaxID=945553 RepID=A0A0D2PZL9_HYPSF|nr:hypothetical protein HYPSUDRAFT_38442 [Hypholoma sublateritium FD-334 SS-4]